MKLAQVLRLKGPDPNGMRNKKTLEKGEYLQGSNALP